MIVLSLVRAAMEFHISQSLLIEAVVGLIRVFCAYARWYSHHRTLVMIRACSQIDADAEHGVGRHFETVPESSVVFLFKVGHTISSIPYSQEHH